MCSDRILSITVKRIDSSRKDSRCQNQRRVHLQERWIFDSKLFLSIFLNILILKMNFKK